MKPRTALYSILSFLIVSLFGLFISSEYSLVFACDRNAPFKFVLSANGGCTQATCNGSTISGKWQAYVAYATSREDFENNKYCSQLEYFTSQGCPYSSLTTSNPCPAGCTDHSQCGSGGTCADGNLIAEQICNGNYGTSNKWCVQTTCGSECDPNPGYCRVKTAAVAREGIRTGCYWDDTKSYGTCQGSGTGMGIDNAACDKCVPPTTAITICSDQSKENLTYSCRPPTSTGSCPVNYTDSKYSPTDCDSQGRVCCYYTTEI